VVPGHIHLVDLQDGTQNEKSQLRDAVVENERIGAVEEL
jgi:hypothetical protein